MEDLLKYLGTATLLTTAVAWLIRSITIHFLSKDIDTFRNRLQAQSNIELEKTKHELHLLAFEHEKRAHLLHERRAQAISELYSRLVEFIWAAGNFSNIMEWSGEPSKEEKALTLYEKTQSFSDYFNKNKIYFSKEVCEKVESVFEEINTSMIKFRVWMSMSKRGVGDSEEYHKAWMDAWNLMKDRVPSLREKIEDEFRLLLGVT